MNTEPPDESEGKWGIPQYTGAILFALGLILMLLQSISELLRDQDVSDNCSKFLLSSVLSNSLASVGPSVIVWPLGLGLSGFS